MTVRGRKCNRTNNQRGLTSFEAGVQTALSDVGTAILWVKHIMMVVSHGTIWYDNNHILLWTLKKV